MNIETIKKIQNEADCLCDSQCLNNILDELATKISSDLKDKNPILLCVMTGGIIPVGHLVTRLTFPLQLDYIHATRYQGETNGGELHWVQTPSISLEGRVILVIDDIFDEGITMREILSYCKESGASETHSCVLVNKLHNRKTDYTPTYVGLELEDRYLFGFGMDYKNYLRNTNAIYAVKGM